VNFRSSLDLFRYSSSYCVAEVGLVMGWLKSGGRGNWAQKSTPGGGETAGGGGGREAAGALWCTGDMIQSRSNVSENSSSKISISFSSL
jgi:hypothetical protein